MIDSLYAKYSDKVRIASVLGAGACGVLAKTLENGVAQIALIDVGGMCALAFVVMVAVDKLEKTVSVRMQKQEEELADLVKKLETNFAYHGLSDVVKDRFTAIEMRDVWKTVVQRTRKEFLAVNYLSPEAWGNSGGKLYVDLLGINIQLEGISAKRLFVLDSDDELAQWRVAFDLHIANDIPIRYMLKTHYDEIVRCCHADSPASPITNGFNVIDADSPGFTVDWFYKANRTTDGALLRRGTDIALTYRRLFNLLWHSEFVKEIPRK